MYPKIIKLNNEKLTKLLNEKEELILKGREISMEIDALEGEMEVIDKELVEAEKAVDLGELKTEAETLTNEYNTIVKKMEELNERTRAKITEMTPQLLRDRYDEAIKKKEEFELERNKIALKAQQKKDKIIPLGQKLMKPFLVDEYDDYDGLRIENGEVVGTIFNHIDDFKKSFKKRHGIDVVGKA